MNSIGNWIAAFWLRQQVALAVLFGRKQRSIELMRKLLALDPDDAVSRNALGNLLFETGEPAAAVAQLETLVALSPDNAEGWFNLGYIHDSRDELDDAERCFRRALGLNAKIDRAWYGLALTLIRSHRLEEAIDALKKNIELQPFSPYGFYQLGMTYHHLGRSSEAQRMVERLQGFEPRFAATLKRDIEQSRPQPGATGAVSSPTIDKEAAATIV